MKKIFPFFLFLILFLPCLSFSRPIMVRLQQKGGEIKEVIYLNKGTKSINILIPGYVNISTFCILKSPMIYFLDYSKIPIEKHPYVCSLREKIKKLNKRKIALENERKINNDRTGYL